MTNSQFRVKTGLRIDEVTTNNGNWVLADGTWTTDGNNGITIKRTDTGDDTGLVLTLQTGETDIQLNDVLGTINFQAPDEGTGSDAILVAAGIEAVSEGDFSSSSNATKLSFKTASTETAAEKMSLSSGGNLTVSGTYNGGGLMTTGGNIVIPNAGNIGSVGDTNAIAISSAGVVSISSATSSSSKDTGALVITDGGMGVEEDIYVGDGLFLKSDGATISLGADDDVTLTHVADNGILMTSGTSENIALELRNTNANSASSVLKFTKDGTSPADADEVGKILFTSEDDGSNAQNYAQILATTTDVSDGSERGALEFRVASAGGLIPGITLTGGVGGDGGLDITAAVGSDIYAMIQDPSGATENYLSGGTQINDIGILNVGGGSTPNSFSATTTTETGSASMTYYTSHLVNTTTYSELKVLQLTSSTETDHHDGLGSAVVIESVDDQNFVGTFYSIDASNNTPEFWKSAGTAGGSLNDFTWASGILYNSTSEGRTDYVIGYHADGYEDCVIGSNNPLTSGKALFRMNTSGNASIGSSTGPSTTATLTLAASGETNVGAVVAFVTGTADPGTTTGKLYNKNGNIHWNGTDLTAAGASNLNALTDVTLTSPAEGAVLVNSGGTFIDALIAGTSNEVEVTNGAGSITIGLPNDVTLTGGLTAASATFTSSSANEPVIHITNTNADATSGELRFNKDSASGADSDVMGLISFYGTDSSNNTHERLAYIDAIITNATQGSEAASLRFYVAENDATLTQGLLIAGHADNNGEVDVTIGAGVTSTTTVNGSLSVLGDFNITGDINSTSVTNLEVDDLTITVAQGAADSAAADGAGLIVDGASASLLYDHTGTQWEFNKNVEFAGHILPNADDTYDIGSSTLAWQDLYLEGDITLTDAGTISTTAGALTLTSAAAATWSTTAGALTLTSAAAATWSTTSGVLTLDGDDGIQISSTATGNIDLDSAADIVLDVADNSDVLLQEVGTTYASLGQGSEDIASIADTAGATLIDRFDCSAYQATKYLIVVEDITNNDFMTTEILLLGDDSPTNSAAYMTQYAVVFNNTELGVFTATGNTSSDNVDLNYDPSDTAGTANHQVRVVATRIASL